jgi:signal transduction histidine kinase
MDVRIIIRKGLIYSTMIAISTSLYLFSIFALGQNLQLKAGYNPLLIGGLIIIVFAFAFQPIKNRVQEIIDRIFFKSRYEYQNTLKNLSQIAVSVIGLDDLLRLMTDRVSGIMKLEGASVLVISKKDNNYQLSYNQNKEGKIMLSDVKADNPLIIYLKKIKRAVVLEEISREIEASGNPGSEKITEAKAVKEELEKLGAALCLPLFFEGKLIGLFNLGAKLSQDMYTDEDIDLLTTLSNQLAIAIENASLHEEMLKAQKQLLMADKLSSLGRVAAGLAHEIKNPLAAVKGMVQTMGNNLNDPEFVKDFKEVVPKEIDRLNNLVENLVRLGRTPKLQFSQVNVNTLIESTLKLFENRCQANNIRINKDLHPVPEIKADPEQLTQVLTNLILNAIQAMPKGGELSFGSRVASHGSIVVEISDTGHGIPGEKLKDIFEPFFSTKEEGLGLGLAITYKIIKDHGGEIEVESEVGRGTRFKITLVPNVF